LFHAQDLQPVSAVSFSSLDRTSPSETGDYRIRLHNARLRRGNLQQLQRKSRQLRRFSKKKSADQSKTKPLDPRLHEEGLFGPDIRNKTTKMQGSKQSTLCISVLAFVNIVQHRESL
jgi:hypothetical protein